MKFAAIVMGAANAATCTYTYKSYGEAACTGTPDTEYTYYKEIDACEENSHIGKYQKVDVCSTSKLEITTYDNDDDDSCTEEGVKVSMSWNQCNQASDGNHYYPAKDAKKLVLGGAVAMAAIYLV